MKRIADMISILDSKELNGCAYEVCAVETGDFDEESSLLTLNLDSFVRRVSQRNPVLNTHPAWLPAPEILRHHVSRSEATDEARAVFQDWKRKVERSVPSTAFTAYALSDPGSGLPKADAKSPEKKGEL